MKVSIITVCLNAKAFIAETIESVLGQDYPHLEYIVMDGGSTDGTIEIISKYSHDARMKWSSGPDLGIADAMNKGASLATGEIIAHLNADDYYPNGRIVSRVVQCFQQSPATIWLTGGLDFVAESGEVLQSVKVRRFSFRRLVRGNIILHPSTFIRRSFFEKVGGFKVNLRYCMDYDLFLRLGEIAKPYLLNEQLSCFRVHSGSRTLAESENTCEEEFKVRCDYLVDRGKIDIFYRIDYKLRKYISKQYYYRLSSAANKQRCL